MAARQPNLAVAAIELGFIVLALALGRVTGHWGAYALAAAAAAIYWAWTRRAQLAAMSRPKAVTQGALAIALLLGILAAAFWIGLLWRGTP